MLAVLVATGCGGRANTRIRIGLVGVSEADYPAARIIESIKSSAGSPSETIEPSGLSRDADPAAEAQACLDRGATALAVCLADLAEAPALIEAAKARHVPVIFFGQRPGADDMVRWDRLYYVGTREGNGASVMGQMAAAWWKANPSADRNRDSMMQYVMLEGLAGVEGQKKDQDYCVGALAEAGIKVARLAGITLATGTATAPATREKARAAMARFLSRYGARLEFVFCDSDEAILGAMDALKDAGYSGKGRTIPVMGMGAGREAMDAIGNGEILATVLADQDTAGKAVYGLAAALSRDRGLEGLSWPVVDNKYVWIPPRVVAVTGLAAAGGP